MVIPVNSCIKNDLFQGALGLELWSMSDDIVFDNFLITDDRVVAETWATESWEIKRVQERGSSGVSYWLLLF